MNKKNTTVNLDELKDLREQAMVRGAGSPAWIKSATAFMDAFPSFYEMAKAMNARMQEMQIALDAETQTRPQPAQIPPVLVRDAAQVLGSSVPEICQALVKLGYPPRSTNTPISGEELVKIFEINKKGAE